MTEKEVRKGVSVRFRFGVRFCHGVVTEDRGPLGIKGRHLYGIEFHLGPDSEEPSYIELPASDLELVRDAAPTR